MNDTIKHPKPDKPLGQRAYGSIPHLPGSRRGPGDHGISEQQALICTDKTRDKHDFIVIEEKLDGTCVAVAKNDGNIVPLIRAGYPAIGSNYVQHHYFHAWVMSQEARFSSCLEDGDRIVGEWLMQAHGTKYNLPHEPFVVFDVMRGHSRALWGTRNALCAKHGFTFPKTVSAGEPKSIDWVLQRVEPSGHGAIEPVEGAVWRVERKGLVDFLAKYVRPDKEDGKYLEIKTGAGPVWNVEPRK